MLLTVRLPESCVFLGVGDEDDSASELSRHVCAGLDEPHPAELQVRNEREVLRLRWNFALPEVECWSGRSREKRSWEKRPDPFFVLKNRSRP